MRTSSVVRRESGISLIVVLLLLLVMTLLGLAVLRSTLLEERMSANMYDRSLAFQVAEGALRDAEKVIQTAAAAGQIAGYTCPTGTVCNALPANTYTGNASGCSGGAQSVGSMQWSSRTFRLVRRSITFNIWVNGRAKIS